MELQMPISLPTFSASRAPNESNIFSRPNSGNKRGHPQNANINSNVPHAQNNASMNQDADIIELDITPPTSPPSLATHLSSRMEEAIASNNTDTNLSRSNENNSNLAQNPEMIRSLNLIPTTEQERKPNCTMSNRINTFTQSPFNSGPSSDMGVRNMR